MVKYIVADCHSSNYWRRVTLRIWDCLAGGCHLVSCVPDQVSVKSISLQCSISDHKYTRSLRTQALP